MMLDRLRIGIIKEIKELTNRQTNIMTDKEIDRHVNR